MSSIHLKVLLYASKIRFPRFPAWFYPFYLLILHKQLEKRNKQFQIHIIPDDLIIYLLNKYSKNFNHDCNNCVIINKRFCDSIDLKTYGKIISDSRKKLVQIIPLDVPDESVYISQTFYHNFTKITLDSVRIAPVHFTSIKIAKEVEICLISSGYDINNNISDTLLKNYFKSPKLIQKGDVVPINIKHYAPEFIYNFKTNSVINVYFKCVKIKYNEYNNCSGGFYCVNGETELRQSAHVQGYLPAKFTNFITSKIDKNVLCLINKCPYGYEDRIECLRKAVIPFLKNRKNCLKPVFLVRGYRGNGKNLLVSTLSDELGLNYYKISSSDVETSVYAQTEIKIKNAFFKAKLCAPSIFVINNFENFGKNNEGQYDQRIINYFKYELTNCLANNNPPMIVFCISNTKEIPAELNRVFLEIFDFAAPDQCQRSKILQWMLDSKSLNISTSLEDLAGKTHGFLYEDLVALVYYAEKSRFEKDGGNLDEMELSADDFNVALDTMQSNYTESLGAPKVPKVQWSDVGGLNDVKTEIIRTINLPLKHPNLLKTAGLKRSGILLYGPPGTGKTLIAKAVATECGLCFLSVKGPELLNMYVGQSEQNVRDVFERAREASPCIIFFDELDSLAPNRGISGDSGGVMDRVVSQLLSEMDGLNKEATIFIIGATNRPDLIDPALLRPGRFDKLLYVGPAETHEAKVSVLKALTRRFKLNEDVDLDKVVKICPENISGADFYGLCSNAWMSAVRQLIIKIKNGELNNEDVSHEDVIVSIGDFKKAAETIKPSISPSDLKYFENLKRELSTKN